MLAGIITISLGLIRYFIFASVRLFLIGIMAPKAKPKTPAAKGKKGKKGKNDKEPSSLPKIIEPPPPPPPKPPINPLAAPRREHLTKVLSEVKVEAEITEAIVRKMTKRHMIIVQGIEEKTIKMGRTKADAEKEKESI